MCKGGSLGIMTGFNRIGCRYVATHTDLITDVLKGEWAFQGHVTTDAGDAGYKSHMLEQLAAGIDYTCWNTKTEDISAAIESGDGLALQLLRQSAKHSLYAASRSTSVNGLSSNTIVVTIIPAWQTALAASACNLLSVMCLSGAIALFFLNSFPVWADELNGITMYASRGGLPPVIVILILRYPCGNRILLHPGKGGQVTMKQNWKKGAAVLTAAVLMAGLLAGCGTSAMSNASSYLSERRRPPTIM